MRKLLLWIVIAEGAALCAGALAWALGVPLPRREPPLAPVFRPQIEQAVIGDKVRYQRRALLPDGTEGAVLGYLDYEVKLARETEGTTFGREFVIGMTESDVDGKERTRTMLLRPRGVTHGFLPPRIDEDDRPTGALPVISSISTARVELPWKRKVAGRREPIVVDGFLVEAVHPRESLTEVRERYWFADRVAMFGVARWERGDEVLEIYTQDRGGEE